MSTVAQEAAEALTIRRCWDVLHRARTLTPDEGGAELKEALDDLLTALETYEDLRDGTTHPGWEWPDLEHEDNATDIALWRAAEDAEKDAAYVIGLAGKLCGPEAGRFARDGEREMAA